MESQQVILGIQGAEVRDLSGWITDGERKPEVVWDLTVNLLADDDDKGDDS